MLSNNQNISELLAARVQFGHLTKRWNPKTNRFIIGSKNGIHIIDLNKTLASLSLVCEFFKSLSVAGKRILFVGTKDQAKIPLKREVSAVNMPFVVDRWLGGLLTNFIAFRKLIKKCGSFDKLINSADYKNLTKKERLSISRERQKLSVLLEGLVDVTRLPSALFVVDVNKEHIAVKEARKLGIPVVAMLDTNCNPDSVDFSIPSNDDSSNSIEAILKIVCSAISEGAKERLLNKQKADLEVVQEKELVDIKDFGGASSKYNDVSTKAIRQDKFVDHSKPSIKEPFDNKGKSRGKNDTKFTPHKFIPKKKQEFKDNKVLQTNTNSTGKSK